MSLEARIARLEETSVTRDDLERVLEPLKDSMERALAVAEARVVLDERDLVWRQERTRDWLALARETAAHLCAGMVALFKWPGILIPGSLVVLLLLLTVPEGYRVQLGTSGIVIERLDP